MVWEMMLDMYCMVLVIVRMLWVLMLLFGFWKFWNEYFCNDLMVIGCFVGMFRFDNIGGGGICRFVLLI